MTPVFKVTETEPTVQFTWTLSQMQVIYALFTGIKVQSTGLPAKVIKDFYNGMKEAGISSDKTYSDYFKGEVETKPVLA